MGLGMTEIGLMLLSVLLAAALIGTLGLLLAPSLASLARMRRRASGYRANGDSDFGEISSDSDYSSGKSKSFSDADGWGDGGDAGDGGGGDGGGGGD
ncbi:MAG: hypothetical protein RMJ83_01945 [Armatimonadota bacterium]|nr:hypothetical protein [Armatimonadota bacterium]